MIFTFDAHAADAEGVFVQQGLFTSDDLADLPGTDEDARARAYVESLLTDALGAVSVRLWRRHIEPLSLLDTTPPDLTWTLVAPGGAP